MSREETTLSPIVTHLPILTETEIDNPKSGELQTLGSVLFDVDLEHLT